MSYIGTMRRIVPKPESLEQRLEQRLARKRSDVFLREDFSDLGGYDQVGRALRELVQKGKLMKVGYGLYTRARRSRLDGTAIPTKNMREIANEALNRIGVKTGPSRYEQAYNAGTSTQVPTGRVIGVLGRVRRKITYNGVSLRYERVGPSAR